MSKMKLNDKSLASLKGESKRIQVFDSKQPGLALRITPDGIKTFSVVYKIHGRMRRYTLGKYPAVTLADARKKANQALVDVQNGEDPMSKKAALRIAGTLEELTKCYMDEHSKLKKKSWQEDQRMFDAYVLPALKHAKASAVTIDDIEALLDGVSKRGKVMANRVRSLLRHMFRWAILTRKHRKQFALKLNPCADVQRLTDETARNRVYSDDELKAIWKACQSPEVGMVGNLFQLQLLTATRKGELMQMEWREIDLENSIWTQPGEKTKNGEVHVVPLSAPAVRILQQLQKRQAKLKNKSKKESLFVFHSSRTGAVAMTWLQKAADRVKDESKIEDFRAHDLRRTAATRLAKAGIADSVLKMILNHSLGKDVTGVYNQYNYFEERKKALSTWASRLMAITSGLKIVASGPDVSAG